MNEPFSFPSQTERLGLPLLFSGQAQKEFYINQSLSVLDSILQFSIEGTFEAPPFEPIDGSIYRVAPAAIGDWAGQDNTLAIRIAGSWHHIAPNSGMRVFDRSTKHLLLFDDGWKAPAEPTLPSGGAVIDTQVREALEQLIVSLRFAGVFPNPEI